MLGVLYTRDPKLLDPITPAIRTSGALFKRNARGKWRFHFTDARGEVDRIEEQRQLFLLNSTGRKGTWDDRSRAHARTWAAGLATVFENPTAIQLQRDFTVPRLYNFALPYAKRQLDAAPQTPIGNAFTCAFLSFAANNPTRAEQALRTAMQAWGPQPAYTREWLVAVLERLTFQSGITIYPHRYNAIRPVLERLYQLDLPDFASGLQGNLSPLEIQSILVHQFGYHLGTSGPQGDGVDGVWGIKSTRALMEFQRRNNIDADGLPDAVTNAALIKAKK
jgi:peptidoglycan hydrolase-like protein with peptidoglycan-binding domain